MQIGQKGTKYGLQVRGPARPAAKQPAVKPVAAAFGGGSDSDEEENVGAQAARQAVRKQTDAKVQEMYAAALAEDPTAFDYDGVYDSIHAQKAAPRHEERIQRQSRYIASLVEQATVRKKEQDIAFERKLLKERQKEDGQYADEEKFVTAAYRRKLEEDKQWLAAQKQRDAQEEAEDVRKKGNLNDFYGNLLAKNVAFGAAGPQQQQQQREGGEEEQQGAAAARPSSRAAADDDDRGGRGGGGSSGDEQQGAGPGPSSRAAAAAAGQSASPDRQQQQRGEDRGGGTSQRGPAAAAAAGSPGRAPPEAGSGDPGREGASAAAAAAGAKRKADADAVAAARERYLARKKQQAAGGS